MKILNLVICLVSFNNFYAQDSTVFAPIGAMWHYNSYNYFDGSPIYFKFVAEKDTFILGQNARLLRYYVFENNTFQSDNNLNKYIFTDGNKVYYKVENEFVLLFDFGAQPGDTINSKVEDFPVYMGCNGGYNSGTFNYRYVIDSVGFIEISGISFRKQFVSILYEPGSGPTWYFYNPIIERIGANDYGGFWWGQGLECILEDNGFLRCYEDQDIFYKNLTAQFQNDCDYTGTNEIEVAVDNQIYPNPLGDILYLKKPSNLLNIYNSSGQKLRNFINQDRIDLSDLSAGIYFIQYQLDDFWQIEKFIKL